MWSRRVSWCGLLRTAVAGLVVLAMLRLVGWGEPAVEAVIQLRSVAGADGEIFYARRGQDYHPDRRVTFPIVADGQWRTYRIALPERRGLGRLRLDPGSTSGLVEVRKITVEVASNSTVLAGAELSAAVGALNDLAPVGGGSALSYLANAPDSYIDFRLPPGAGVPPAGLKPLLWWGAAAVAALLWLAMAEWGGWRWARRLAPSLAPPVLQRWAARASDLGVLVVPPAALAVVGTTIGASLLYIALNLHQSSIGIWENIYPTRPVPQRIDLGEAKRIRSDEWNTQTPWVLGQVANGMPSRNPSIGGERAPMLASVPVGHVSAAAQPKFYGFYLFDAATGFSWLWAYKTFGLGLSFFWLFLVLTRGNVAASALGAAWVYGSSSTQWWLSSNLPELLTAFALATTGAAYLLFAQRRVMVGVGAALVAYAVLSLLLHLYPPFIIPLAYLGVALIAGLMLEPGSLGRLREGWPWRAMCLAAATVLVAVVGGCYLMDAFPSIEVMAKTSYPGRRVSVSGDLAPLRLFYGFFEVFRIGEERLPLPPTNASEASSFILLAPLLLLAVPVTAWAKRGNALLTALLFYCALVALWITVPLPRVAEAAMQAVGWSWSPPVRSVLGVGIASIIASTVLFARVQDHSIALRPTHLRLMLPIGVFVCLLAYGWFLSGIDPVFFQPRLVLWACAVVATMAAGIVLGRTGIFATGLALAVLPALMVNPLMSGLSALLDKPVLQAARQQSAEGARWAVVGDFVLSQGLKAQGLEVVTGSQMIPDRAMAQSLDPDARYENVWNRYAHVVLTSAPGNPQPVYQLRGSDLYEIAIDVCGSALPGLGVTHVAYTGAVPEADLACLAPLRAPADSGVRMFRLSSTPAPPLRGSP